MTDYVLVVEDESVLTVVEGDELLVSTNEETVILEVAQQGLPGPQGPPGQAGATFFDFLADGPVGGHRAVVMTTAGKVGYADSTNPAHANGVVGITLGAAVDGASIQVQNAGEITEPSWSWTINQPVFLSTNGLLTQTPPATGFQLIVGIPTAANTLVVDIKLPFVLEA